MNTTTKAPARAVVLQAINSNTINDKEPERCISDELLEIPIGCTAENVVAMLESVVTLPAFFIWCEDTLQMWCAPTEDCLNTSFIYRGDLEIAIIEDVSQITDYYEERAAKLQPGSVTSKKCFILNNPPAETYEVYYASNYPVMRYGKVTPDGMTVMAFNNRFERDAAILKLEEHYSRISKGSARSLVKKAMTTEEAVIVSDGCVAGNIGACAAVYIDMFGVTKQVRSLKFTSDRTNVLIAELEGALLAFRICAGNRKKKVTYYTDNRAVLEVIQGTQANNKVAQKLQQIISKLRLDGANITCLEVHPKNKKVHGTGDKAIQHFHNLCDKECTAMLDLHDVFHA